MAEETQKLTVEQRIQIARIAADLAIHHSKNLTTPQMDEPVSKQLARRNYQNLEGLEPHEDSYPDLLEFEQTFDWAFDLVLERVTGAYDLTFDD